MTIIAAGKGTGEWAVRLAIWRKNKGMNQLELADELGVSQPYISMIERIDDPQIPRRDIMLKIYRLTGGDVEPNDFYELPPLGQLQLNVSEPGPAPLFEGAS